jgi:hypothetical protein
MEIQAGLKVLNIQEKFKCMVKVKKMNSVKTLKTDFDVVIDSVKYTYKVYNTFWSDSLKYKKVFTFKDVNKLKALGEVVEKTILKNKP